MTECWARVKHRKRQSYRQHYFRGRVSVCAVYRLPPKVHTRLRTELAGVPFCARCLRWKHEQSEGAQDSGRTLRRLRVAA